MPHPPDNSVRPHVVIIGGGFGGLQAAKGLRNAPVEVTLIDRRNFHLFQPLLYQVATGGLGPAEIAVPLRALFKYQRNIRVLNAEVVAIDPQQQRVHLDDDEAIPYDYLIVAAGASYHYFGHDEWAKHAPGLKTIEDAQEIRRRVLLALEHAERESDPQRQQAWLTFVIVGGGPTGVELAGALAELVHATVRGEFRRFDPAKARLLLLEGGPRLLPTYPPDLSANAHQSLRRLGVEVVTNALVNHVDAQGVQYTHQGESVWVEARTVLWAAGVRAAPLAEQLAQRTNAPTDKVGRLIVEPDLSLPGYPNLFVIGDLAHYAHQTGSPLPGVAPVALQQGSYVARVIRERLHGRQPRPFRYKDKGDAAVIGRKAAVIKIGRLHLTGFIAWLGWLFIHLLYLVGFENKLLVMIQWAWNYFTRNRRARLILYCYGTPPHAPESRIISSGEDARREQR
ncbi:NADH dehydrogenase-like protein [bacterium HR15]|nr:NADH dehydrogenase-like protein [bacterium HR15]